MKVDHVRFANPHDTLSDNFSKTVTVTIETEPKNFGDLSHSSTGQYQGDGHTSGHSEGTASLEEIDLLELLEYDFLPPPRPLSPLESNLDIINEADADADKSESDAGADTADRLSDTEKSEFESFMKEILEFNWENKINLSHQMVGFESLENLQKIGDLENKRKAAEHSLKRGPSNASTKQPSDRNEDEDYDDTADMEETPTKIVVTDVDNVIEMNVEEVTDTPKSGLVGSSRKRSLHKSKGNTDRSSSMKRKGFVFEEEKELQSLMETLGHFGHKWARMENLNETSTEREDVKPEVDEMSWSYNVNHDAARGGDDMMLTHADELFESHMDGIDNPMFNFSLSDTGSPTVELNREMDDLVKESRNMIARSYNDDFTNADSKTPGFEYGEKQDEIDDIETGSVGFVNDGYVYDEVPSTESTTTDTDHETDSTDIDERHISFASFEIKVSGTPDSLDSKESVVEMSDTVEYKRQSCEDLIQSTMNSLKFIPSESELKEHSRYLNDNERYEYSFGSPELVEYQFIPISKDDTDSQGIPSYGLYEDITGEKKRDQDKESRSSVSMKIEKQLQSKPFYENSKQELVEELKYVLSELKSPENRLNRQKQMNGDIDDDDTLLEDSRFPFLPRRQTLPARLGHSVSFSVRGGHREPDHTSWLSDCPRKPERSHSLSGRSRQHTEVFDWFQRRQDELRENAANKKSNVMISDALHVRSYSADNILDLASTCPGSRLYENIPNRYITNTESPNHHGNQFKTTDGDEFPDYDFADVMDDFDSVIKSSTDIA